MKKFITTRPDITPVGLGSSYEPVLAGVAQGLARLFPPVESACPPRGGAKTGGGSPARTQGDAAPGGGERG